jgi:hypothetical protein
MREYLVSEITKREGELDAAAQRIRDLESELRVLRNVLARHDQEAREGSNSRRDPREGRPRQGTKGSRIGPRWRPVALAAILRYPEFIQNEQVPEIQQRAEQKPASLPEIRSHVYTYVRDGFYERGDGSGTFRATPQAAEAMGVSLGGSANHKTSPQGEDPDFG